MKIALAQTRFKTADFEFNYNTIVEKIENTNCDLIVFPEYDLTETGGKDLVLDENCCLKQDEFYARIADKNFNRNILIGEVLIRNGQVEISEDGFFDIGGKKVFVSDSYRNDVVCDL